MAKYVDGFVVPVPKNKVDEYRKIARKAGKIWKEYGAMVRASRAALRKADPGAKLVLAGMTNFAWEDLAKLFKHGKITTTETKAKRLRPFAEHLITRAKRGDLASFRRVLRVIHELETRIGCFFDRRPDGRIHQKAFA